MEAAANIFGMPFMANTTVMLLLMLLALAITQSCMAVQYPVGGSQGWDLSTDFNTWESGKTFKVGDTLSFKYTTGLHSVVELASEKDYNACNIGNPVNSLSGGSNVVKLNKAGTRYFACGTPGHCSGGMKMKVKVVAAGTSPTPSSTPSSTSSTSTSSAIKFSPASHIGLIFISCFSLMVMLLID
uniref:Phytocyanin domain-containing protein n=1 Tax=Picea sitchensis TaxID=3332 RepID=A9P1G7_PICSI|nr:unknown [Picea sitchensis]